MQSQLNAELVHTRALASTNATSTHAPGGPPVRRGGSRSRALLARGLVRVAARVDRGAARGALEHTAAG